VSKNGTSWRKSSEEMTEAHLLKPLETELAAWERSPSARRQYPLIVRRYLETLAPMALWVKGKPVKNALREE